MASIELRKASDGTVTISGLASRYDTWYKVGGFKERIMRGAFDATLRADPDVLLRVNHQDTAAIARTPDTLKLWADDDGLRFRATVNPALDSDARQAVHRIETGTYREASFCFARSGVVDEWNSNYDERTIRSCSIDRGDVAIVPFGASRSTSVAVERAFAGASYERRSALAQAISSRGLAGRYWLREAADGTTDASTNECPECDGSGHLLGGICPMCGGLGVLPADDDGDEGDGRSQRGQYSEAEKATLGAKGQAIKYNGSWHFPVVSRQDLLSAIHLIGQAPQSMQPAVKRYLIGRAKALNASRMIPAAWSSGSRASTPADLRMQAESLRARALEMEVAALVEPRMTAMDFARRYRERALEARMRGDFASAATYDRAAETEIHASIAGL
jgi:HK97 family phage prohead protease